MDTSSKNRLQEYCMKNKLYLPNYRIKRQSGPAHSLRFQVEVEVNGEWYIGNDLCSSRKQAEQSAASKALEVILYNNEKTISADDLDPPPPYSEVVKSSSTIEHLPAEYAHIERYISAVVESFGGRIRKIWTPDSDGIYKFEIAGSYRYCDNVQRHHRRNQIYFMVNPTNKSYYQMCHALQCSGFRSVTRNIATKSPVSIQETENNCDLLLTNNVDL